MIHEIEEMELQKVKNKHKTGKVFGEQNLLNRVMKIAFFENMGKLEELNNELEAYDAITPLNLQLFLQRTISPNKQSILRVKKTS